MSGVLEGGELLQAHMAQSTRPNTTATSTTLLTEERLA
jgi:hypothetical protein